VNISHCFEGLLYHPFHGQEFLKDEDEDPEDEATVILRNVTNCLLWDTAFYPRRLSFSDKRLFPRVHIVSYIL